MTADNARITPVSQNAHKRPFDFRLFLEGIRQLRTLGIVMCIIFSLEAILVPISKAIDNLSTLNYGGTIQVVTTSPYDFHGMLVLVFLLIAPILTLSVFSFLNKRNTSDFYHSIPYTRVCLYFSFFAAVMAWIVVISFGSTLISLLTQTFFPRFFRPMTVNYFMFAFSVVIASFLSAAVTLLSMTMTGTTFSNVIITGLILFAPRILVMILSEALDSLLPIIPDGALLDFVSSSDNIVMTFIFNFLILSDSPEEIFYSWKAVAYTGILAAAALAVGAILFRLRKSETATQPAPNRKVQSVFRIALTSVFCAIPLGEFLSFLVTGHGDFDFSFVVFYIIAIVLYCLYELISTKKWKNVLKALPGLLVVALVNAVMLFGMYLVYLNQLNFAPDAEELKSVSVYTKKSEYNYGISLKQYYDLMSDDLELTDPEILKIAADALKENTDVLRASNDGTIRDKYKKNNYYHYFLDTGKTYLPFTLEYRTAFGEKKRIVYIAEEQYGILAKALSENKAYRIHYSELPDAYYLRLEWGFTTDPLTDRDLDDLYSVMKYEIAQKDFSEWYQYVAENENSIPYTDEFSLIVGAKNGFDTCTVRIPISKTMLPQTFEKLMELFHRYMEEQHQQFHEFAERAIVLDIDNVWISASIYGLGDEVYCLSADNHKKGLDFSQFMQTVDGLCGEGPIKKHDATVIVEFYFERYDETGDKYENNSLYFILPLKAEKTDVESLTKRYGYVMEDKTRPSF